MKIIKNVIREINIFTIDCIYEFVNIIIIMSLFLAGFVIMPLYLLRPIF